MEIKRSFRNMIKTVMFHGLFPRLYKIVCRRGPADARSAVFFEEPGKHVSDNSRIMRARMQKEGWKTRTVCLNRNGGFMGSFFAGCLKSIPALARAKVIFLEDSSELISCLPLRSDTKVIQLWHACGAFKRFGYSLEGKKYGAKAAELNAFPRHRNFTYVTVSSPEVAWAYAQAFHMEDRPEAIVPVGIARTDLFFKKKQVESARQKLQALTGGRYSRFLLYAPTFRGGASNASTPPLPDFALIHDALGPAWGIVINQHPFIDHRPSIPQQAREYVFDMTGRMGIQELMMAGDICITDYSSIVFEYALLERPMLFFAPDLEEYDDWRGFYYPYEEMTPGPVLTTSCELADRLRDIDRKFDKEQLHRFREKFMSACDGHAVERILALAES